MGNSDSKYTSNTLFIESDYNFVSQGTDPRYGEVKILKSKKDQTQVCVI